MRNPRPVAALVLFSVRIAAGATVVDDTFADANSQNQDLTRNSLWLFNGRSTTVRSDQPGAVSFDVTPTAANSEAFWAYFTPSGAPVVLGVGEKLSVAVTFSLSGFLANSQDIRWGVFDSLGTRNAANLTGGQNDATFVNDPGYGLQFIPSGTASTPFVIARRTVLASANVFNSFGDFTPIPGAGATVRQTLADDTAYTLTYTIERLSETDTRVSTAVTGGALADFGFASVETSATPNTSFDYFAFRFGGTNFTSKITFTELRVDYTPAPPVITSQPQPSSLTVQVGSNVTVSVGASGNQLAYQWQRNGQPVAGNASATTATLKLTNVQHADAGSYTAVVSNSGGSATSNAVTLAVSDTPVPPPPSITAQPKDTRTIVGGDARLTVAATGAGLVYQWFKNGAVLAGANGSALELQNAQVGDSAGYYVVISNSSGSVASASANLLVVSAMQVVNVGPFNGQNGVCGDRALTLDFDQPPLVGKTGRINIYNARDTLVDTIDMAANPQTKVVGGNPYAYYPIIVAGNTAAIYPHRALASGETYYVLVDAGVVTDAAGAPFAGISNVDEWRFRIREDGPAAGSTSLTVTGDGTGDFCTVQGAIDFVPVNNTQPVTITVRKGTYTEIVYVTSNKAFITVRGEDRDASVIQYANNNNLNPSTSSRAMFGVDAPDFTLENITLINTTPHLGSQAEAFRGNNQRILLNRVTLRSFQDTLMLQGGGFVTDSFIEGDVDFMWGNGPVYIQNSELKAATSGGYYTQIRNGQGQGGYVFVNSRLTSEPGVTGMYLSRIDPTVFPFSQVVYLNCAMGAHIIPAGWLLNNATAAPSVQFWEYRSTDLNGAALNVGQRAAFSRQLTQQEAAPWLDPATLLNGWVPYTVGPDSPTAAGGSIVAHWSAAPGHSAKDWIGLYRVGDPDTSMLAMQYTGSGTTGRVTLAAPSAGQYELRYFVNDGLSRAASSDRVTVPAQ